MALVLAALAADDLQGGGHHDVRQHMLVYTQGFDADWLNTRQSRTGSCWNYRLVRSKWRRKEEEQQQPPEHERRREEGRKAGERDEEEGGTEGERRDGGGAAGEG